MGCLKVIFYNISHNIKNSLSNTRILYIPAWTESSLFFVKCIIGSGLGFCIIPLLPFHHKASLFFFIFSWTSSCSCFKNLGKS